MGYRAHPANPEKVVKIECLDLPEHFEKDEGYYELRWAHKPKDVETHDVITIKKAIQKLMPLRTDDILDRLQNFQVAYLNLETGEISS